MCEGGQPEVEILLEFAFDELRFSPWIDGDVPVHDFVTGQLQEHERTSIPVFFLVGSDEPFLKFVCEFLVHYNLLLIPVMKIMFFLYGSSARFIEASVEPVVQMSSNPMMFSSCGTVFTENTAFMRCFVWQEKTSS